MAQHEEPMDIDEINENKENSLPFINVLTTEENIPDNRDSKTRSSNAPLLLMSKSYTDGYKVANQDVSAPALSQSLDPSLTQPPKPLPLQTITSDKMDDDKMHSPILRPRDGTVLLDNQELTVTVSDNNENFDSLSFPSTSESPNSTPELLTPVNETPKPSGSPIMRGLRSMLSMFRPSQSPVPGDDDEQTKENINIAVNSPEPSKITNTQQLVASTPLATNKVEKNSVFKEGVAFDEDLEKALLWEEETTIIFSKEKLPVHKLLFTPLGFTPQKVNAQPSTNKLNVTSEPMDISFNNSVVANKTVTDICPSEFVSANNSIVEKDDSMFVDCETTFNANETHNITNTKLEDIFEDEPMKTTPEITSNKTIENINCKQSNLEELLEKPPEIISNKNINNDQLNLDQSNRNATIMNNNETFDFTMNQTNTVDQFSATKDIIDEIDSLTQDKEITLQAKYIENDLSSSDPNETILLQNESNNEELTHDKTTVEINNTTCPSLLTQEIPTEPVVQNISKNENVSNETLVAVVTAEENYSEIKSKQEGCESDTINHNSDSVLNSLIQITPCETNTDIETNENKSTNQSTVAEMNEVEAEPSAESMVPDKIEEFEISGDFDTTLKDTNLEVEQPKEFYKKAEKTDEDNRETKITSTTDIMRENKINKEYEINLNITGTIPSEDQINIVNSTAKVENLSMELTVKNEDIHEKENLHETFEYNVGYDSNIKVILENDHSQHEIQEKKGAIDSQAQPQIQIDPNHLLPEENKSSQQETISDYQNSNETFSGSLINKADSNKELVSENSEENISAASTGPSKENMDKIIDEKQETKEDIIISESTTPVVDTSLQQALRSSSPPIQVKNTSYDNFDDIEDPFNLKSKNKNSISPIKSRNETINTVESRIKVTPNKGSKTSEKAKVVVEHVAQKKDTKITPENENIMNATYDTESHSLQFNANKTYECTTETNVVNKNEVEMNMDVSMEDLNEKGEQFQQNNCNKSVVKEKNVKDLSTELATNATFDISKTCKLDQGVSHTFTEPLETDTSCTISNTTFETKTPVNPFEGASKDFDDVNVSKDSDEFKTDEEDTVEGPDIEFFLDNGDEQPRNEQDIVSNKHNEEIFIDAEGFDFLMNKNNNEIIESGKESLFLKFDPLYANRVNSDGVVEALKSIRKRQSLRTKARQSNLTLLELSPPQASSSKVNNIMDDSIEVSNSSVAFTNKGNSESLVEVLKNMERSHNQTHETQQWEDKSLLEMSPSRCVNSTVNNNLMNESFDEFNSTMIHKPTMAVPPAVNQIPTNIRNTPARPVRQSTAYMSPAIAVIDRLISLSANNSYSNLDMTLTQDAIEHERNDVIYSQFREMLTDKEVEVQNLKLTNRELIKKVSTVESILSDLEKESERKLKIINELSAKLDENKKRNIALQEAIAEYEVTISNIVQEIEKDKQKNQIEKEKLTNERDEYLTHLSSVEAAFSDLHNKYEKNKQLIMTYKYQEQTYKRQVEETNEKVASLYRNYETLQQHAASKFEKAYNELDKINKQHESEMLKIKTLLKRKEMDIVSLEESLAQKTKVNAELTSICDELIGKVGKSG